MSTYHLQQVFRPTTVAVVGGSPRDRSAGRAVVRNLRAAGFPGQIGWVSPRYSEIDGVRTVARLTDLPWVGHRSKSWEPEPLRWLGINAGLSAAAL